MADYRLPTNSYLRLNRDTGMIHRIRTQTGDGVIYEDDHQIAGSLEDWLANRPDDLKHVRGYRPDEGGGQPESVPDPLDFSVGDGELARRVAGLDTQMIQLMMNRDPRGPARAIYLNALETKARQYPKGQRAHEDVEKVATEAANKGSLAALRLAKFNWGSDEALELAFEALVAGDLDLRRLAATDPGGKTGYTVADVRGVIADSEEE